MRRATWTIAAIALSLVSQPGYGDHATLPKGVTPEMATWLWGYHVIPGSITRDGSPYLYAYPHTDVSRINDPPWTEVAAKHVKPGTKAPAVLFLHGCSGLARGGTGYRLMLINDGYAVFSPDAYARKGHSCERSSTAMRRAEIAYAFGEIRKLPWIDQERIVLMGDSQGGRAVAWWDQPGFAAHIILASNCNRHRAVEGAVPRAPAGVPILAVVGDKDELLHGSSCKVSRTVGGSKSMAIEGAGHDILGLPETKSAVRVFLRDCCS